VAALIVSTNAVAQSECPDSGALEGGVYLDAAYLYSPNEPDNNDWRTKGTSASIGVVRVNNATAFLQKQACRDSRWGVQVGLQAGEDIESLVPSDSVSAAETLKHLYYTNLSYLAPLGNGLLLTGGFIPGNIGYESFTAIDNPTYTRVYAVDWVPYFHLGVNATYPWSDRVATSLLVVNGWDYLAFPNGLPSYGFQLAWNAVNDLALKLNLYYGPEQEETSLDLWRFVSEVNGDWQIGDFLVAGSIGIGTEKQADVANNPRHDWAWAAAWLQWQALDWVRAAVRPEVFLDEDGLAAGTRQTIGAITASLDVRLPIPRSEAFARLEYRYDRSTGPEGGFYEGAANDLVANQHLIMIAVNWRLTARR
jgi:hypothetical protein